MAKRYYLTTPIYYVNGEPHVGTCLTTVIADICARYHKLRGDEVVYLTGTDENAPKVARAAEAAGEPVQAFVDRISQRFVETFDSLNVGYDIFFRTTSEQHKRTVQALFVKLQENGFIYKDTYEGWYDISSETFYKETELVDGKSPEGNEVQKVSEENYFFKLSAFGDKLLAHAEANPEFWLPASRRNEVVSFINQGLRDMCITRKNQGWGIPVPGDEERVIYVWFDALINYLAATGWPDNPDWDKTWPADVHWMAKEIFTRFHATLWPAMLMGAGLPLPKTVIAHGWFVFGDLKMSKSKGNVLYAKDLTSEIVEKTGCAEPQATDALRFALARLLPYEGDTNFTRDEVDKHYNADLANDLGNALNRSLSMAHKFVGGVVPDAEIEAEAMEAIQVAKQNFAMAMAEHKVDTAVDHAIQLVRFLNKYIDTRAPWALAKNEDPALGAVLRSMLACLRAAEGLVQPIMPWSAVAIAEQLGVAPTSHWDEIGTPESLPVGTKLNCPVPLFPRIDPKKAAEVTARWKADTAPAEKPKQEAKPKPATPEPPAEITIEDFAKVQLKVGRVFEAEPLEGSDKLLKLQVIIGEEKRQIVAGIRKNYDSMDLIGRQVIVVYNLKPAKLRGTESQGMLLAATDEDGGAILLQPDREAPEGTGVR
jgi:methionyl-tRNA synthetase